LVHRSSAAVQPPDLKHLTRLAHGKIMRNLVLVLLLAASLAPLPALADDESAGQMVVLRANEIGQIFCFSRLGNDEAVVSGILTADLAAAIGAAQGRNNVIAGKTPDEKPPLGDGIPWQSSPDYADTCQTGLVSLSKSDAKVDIQYGFKDDPAANYTDELILKRVPIDGMDVGYWRIDDVVYADGTDLRDALVHAFDGY
jgi:hypothetical protein